MESGGRLRWYVARALGEETAISVRRLSAIRGTRVRAPLAVLLGGLALTFAACGGGERQDANEPDAKFPVAVQSAKFPTDQRLAQTRDLQLEIENTGQDAIPNLVVTIFTGDDIGGGSFSVRSDQPGLADPNRPVWILESGFPKVVEPGEDVAELDAAPSAGADAAQTDTYAFGPLAAGETRDIVWRVTPVMGGTYTVHYELAAGLTGKSRAVGEDGTPAKGEFVVTVSDKPPRAGVDAAGDVTIETQ